MGRLRCKSARDNDHGMSTRRYLRSPECGQVSSYSDALSVLTSSTYSPKDDSINSVMAIALQNFKVKHIVVTVSDSSPLDRADILGSYQLRRMQSSPGRYILDFFSIPAELQNASVLPPVSPTTALQRFTIPLVTLARTLTTPDGPPTLDFLVEVRDSMCKEPANDLQENVVQQCRNLLASDTVQAVSHHEIGLIPRIGRGEGQMV